jgi:hypothetical protein
LTVADDYSAKEDRFFYAHDAESLSLYVALFRPLPSHNFNSEKGTHTRLETFKGVSELPTDRYYCLQLLTLSLIAKG